MDVAKIIGVSSTNVGKLERTGQAIALKKFKALCEVLGLDYIECSNLAE